MGGIGLHGNKEGVIERIFVKAAHDLKIAFVFVTFKIYILVSIFCYGNGKIK